MTRLNKLPNNAKVKSEIGGNYELKANSKKVYKKKSEGQAKLIIPGKLPTLNDLINAAKANRYKYDRLKKTYQETIGWYVKKQEIPFFYKVKIEITYYRPDRKADIDNISAAGKKLILDTLVKQENLKDDCWSVVKGFEERFEVDKDNPRTEVLLKEVEDGDK
ncbi:MAG: hypothetical protein ACOCQA_01910 [bacterium]